MLSVWFYIDKLGQNISANKNILSSSQADTNSIENFESTSMLGLSTNYEKVNTDQNEYKNLYH